MVTDRVYLIETLLPPSSYPREQLKRALLIAMMLDRGKFILVELPEDAP